MLNFFGLPILFAFAFGYYLPYTALALSPYAFLILFIMMISASLDFNWTTLRKIFFNKYEIIFGLFFLFIFFPLMQWFLAKALINEGSLFNGTLLASICPLAIIAPGFTKAHHGDEDLSFLLLISSMLFFPIAVYFALHLTHQAMHLKPIIIDMIILIFFPIFIGETLKKIDRKINNGKFINYCKEKSAIFNMYAIAFLAFIYLGASVSKLNLNYTPWKEFLGVFIVITFQDFGVYFICKLITKQFFNEEKAKALTISLSMKNFAVSGAILLIYDPKASLASAIGFFIHAIFFSYLMFSAPKKLIT
jgi:predicted Na+-dependent transporter